MASYTPAQVSKYKAADIAKIAPEVMAAWGEDLIGSISQAGANGLTYAQIRMLSSAQIQYLSDNALKGFSAAGVSALTPNDIEQFSENRISKIAPLSFGSFAIDTLNSFSASQCGSLTDFQTSRITPSQAAALKNEFFQYLSPAGNRGLSTNVIATLTADQFAAMANETEKDMQAFSANQFAAMTSTTLTKVSATAVGWMTKEQLGAMSLKAAASLKAEQTATLSAEQITWLGKDAIGGMSTDFLNGLLTKTGKAGLSPIGALTEVQTNGITPVQALTLKADFFKVLSPAGNRGLSPKVISVLTADQFAAMANDSIYDVQAFTDKQFAAMKSHTLSKISAEAVDNLTPEQLKALPPEALAGFNASNASGLKGSDIALFSTKQIANLSVFALNNMSLQAIDALSLEQKGALAQPQLDVIAQRFANTPDHPSLIENQQLRFVSGLDVTSPIVLSFDTLINLGTGKIRIIDDGDRKIYRVNSEDGPIRDLFAGNEKSIFSTAVAENPIKNDVEIELEYGVKVGGIDRNESMAGSVYVAGPIRDLFAGEEKSIFSTAVAENSIKNDVEIELKDGVIVDLKVGGIDRKESMAGSVYVKGTKLIIDPASGGKETGNAAWRFDWDFGNKYHVELDDGVVYKNGGGKSQSNDAVGIENKFYFHTVIPDGEFLDLQDAWISSEKKISEQELKALLTGGPSQKMSTATGELEESYHWHGYLQEDNFSNYSFDFANGKHALVTPFALDSKLGYTLQLNVKNFGVDAGKLTGDDLLYFDKNDFRLDNQATHQNGNDNPVWSDWKRTSTVDDGIATVLKFSYDKLPAKSAAVTSDALFETLFKQDVIQYG